MGLRKNGKKGNEPKNLRISLVVVRKWGRVVFARFRIFYIHRCATKWGVGELAGQVKCGLGVFLRSSKQKGFVFILHVASCRTKKLDACGIQKTKTKKEREGHYFVWGVWYGALCLAGQPPKMSSGGEAHPRTPLLLVLVVLVPLCAYRQGLRSGTPSRCDLD